jgi:hypothetical protein
VDDDLMMDEAKVDDFVTMVERAKTLYSEGGGKESSKQKQKQGEDDTNSNYLLTII